MSEEIQGEQVQPQGEITNSEGIPLKPEEQQALDRLAESRKTNAERETEGDVPEGYNPDGTPIEEMIDGKFKSQEDLLEAYKELEKKLGAKEPEPKQEEATKEQKEQADELSKATGIDSNTIQEFGKEYNENGSLSEESYKKLESFGFSKNDVDRYIQGQQAFAGTFTNSVYEVAGGQEEYSSLVQWAAENVDSAVINDYNKALADLDQANATRHLEYMKLKYQQGAPKEARRLEGDSGGTGMQPFTDKNEWQKAATNRLYGKDAKYTQMVDKRYLASRRKGLI
jgi:hypothetical protein